MYNLTNDQIHELIRCPKVITTCPKRKMTEEMGNYKNSMELQSVDEQYSFSVFMRKNVSFEENFSIGLVYHAKEEPSGLILLRMNGAHGVHNNHWPQDHPHYGYHIHLTKSENILLGLSPERYAYNTDKYTSFEDALIYFLIYCTVKDSDKYFSTLKQITLFEQGGTSDELPRNDT